MSLTIPKVAIVINVNARSVSNEIIQDIKEVATEEIVYISSSPKEAKKNFEKIVKNEVDVVLSAGGDGTFAETITGVLNCERIKTPAFGVLRLGTGNGVAEALRVASFSKKNLIQELQQAKNPEARFQMPILKIGKKYAPFAGTGLDATMLRSYKTIRKLFNSIPFITETNRGVIDYSFAGTIAFWTYLLKKLPEIIIKNGEAKAYRIDFHGKRVGPSKKPGEVLYRGPYLFAAASTVRYYGFDVPIFPQASTLFGGYFQLRVCAMEIYEAAKKITNVLTGTLSDKKLWDFSCKEITMELTGGATFQIGGDSVGKIKKIRIGSENIMTVQGSAAAAPEPPT
ncbi:MAG: hypothetical protein COU51_00480 [Parcubacteria group bacterium CG10_big_fil_rev_8_21_14_0_10_36_14]|nr:MAG: hypothetical protein COU51_00480 [Parcubacteria group bacterium CG10_big_fil_rev_8_21_14_0_10_36_14]